MSQGLRRLAPFFKHIARRWRTIAFIASLMIVALLCTGFYSDAEITVHAEPKEVMASSDKESGEGSQSWILNHFLGLCQTAHKKKDHCYGISDPEFAKFVDRLNRESPLREHVSLSRWQELCQMDGLAHQPVVCVAAAYELVPYPLEPNLDNFRNCSANDQHRNHVQVRDEKLSLLALTVETAELQHACPLIRSASSQRVRLEVLGKGVGSCGPSKKLSIYRDRLLEIPPKERNRTVVMALDSRDVILQATESKLLQRFLESDSRVLFNAEHICFPMAFFPSNLGRMKVVEKPHVNFRQNHVCRNLFPNGAIPLTPSYLNSGAMIGFADALLELMEPIQRVPKWFADDYPGTDQGYFSQIYLSPRFKKTRIDHCKRVFSAQGFKSPGPHFYYPKVRSVNYMEFYARGSQDPKWNTLYLERAKKQNVEKGILREWKCRLNDEVVPIIHLNSHTYKWTRPGTHNCNGMMFVEESIYDKQISSKLEKDATEDERFCWKEELKCGVDHDEYLNEEDFSKEYAGAAFFATFDEVKDFSRIAKNHGPEINLRFAKASLDAARTFGDNDALFKLVDVEWFGTTLATSDMVNFKINEMFLNEYGLKLHTDWVRTVFPLMLFGGGLLLLSILVRAIRYAISSLRRVGILSSSSARDGDGRSEMGKEMVM